MTFLTSKGVYRLLYNSKKIEAEIFREWVGDILDDIIFNECKELRKQIEHKDTLLNDAKQQIIIIGNTLRKFECEKENDIKINRHKVLLKIIQAKNCVYLAEIEKDKIKIGSSKEIEVRKNGIKAVFGNCIFLDAFECDNFRDIESSILNNQIIHKNLYRNVINGHVSKEVVLLNNDFNYGQLLLIVKKHLKMV
jgi:hypothetical protein